MCHQTLEKIFKAYWSSKKVEPAPMSHSLFNIAQSCGLNALFSEDQMDFISEMMPLNVEARYPSYKEKIFEGLSKDAVERFLTRQKNYSNG